MRTLIFLSLAFIFGCTSEETASYEYATQKYREAVSWSGSDYQSYISIISEAQGSIQQHLAEYPDSKDKSELTGFSGKLEDLKMNVQKEQAAYERLVNNRREPSSLEDIARELNEIQRFLASYPQTIRKSEVEQRKETLASMKEEVFIQEMETRMEELWESMDKAASVKADEIHPLSNTDSFIVTANERPQITGPGQYSCKRVYQIRMSGMMWGNFNVIISVEGILRGDMDNGIFYEVGNVTVIQRE